MTDKINLIYVLLIRNQIFVILFDECWCFNYLIKKNLSTTSTDICHIKNCKLKIFCYTFRIKTVPWMLHSGKGNQLMSEKKWICELLHILFLCIQIYMHQIPTLWFSRLVTVSYNSLWDIFMSFVEVNLSARSICTKSLTIYL